MNDNAWCARWSKAAHKIMNTTKQFLSFRIVFSMFSRKIPMEYERHTCITDTLLYSSKTCGQTISYYAGKKPTAKFVGDIALLNTW